MRIALPIIVAVALAVYALVDCGQTERDRVRSLPKPLWLVVVALLPVVGPIAWLVLGRPKAAPAAGPGARPAPRPRPVAPDDDPEFLRQIRNLDEEHEQMLREWEDNLRKREQNLKDDTDDDAAGDHDTGPAARRDEADQRNGPDVDPSDGDTR